MGLIRPDLPDYDATRWHELPRSERLRLACQDWALHGFGTPVITYTFYVIKFCLYVLGWWLFARIGHGEVGVIELAWSADGFMKAVVWTMWYEGLGLGCGSGPLTGRIWPPFNAWWHFLRPGTIRLAPWPRIPGTGGTTRKVADVIGFALLQLAYLNVLLRTEIPRWAGFAILVLMACCAVRDKVVYLAARGEHYVTLVAAYAFDPTHFLSAAKIVVVAIWVWAGVSKFTAHFPSVLGIMVSNSPTITSKRVRKAMYASYPDDLRPSTLAARIAHGGGAFEILAPLCLLLNLHPTLTLIALIGMLVFHTFIVMNLPMGVPIEWNLMMMYSAVLLFGHVRDLPPWDVESPWLWAVLAICMVAIPAYGHVRPDRISFLPGMRYYAGNWAFSAWLLGPGVSERLEERLVKLAPDMAAQANRLFDEVTVGAMTARGQAFRAMHLHGRALHQLLPVAAGGEARLDRYEVRDGEVVAAIALGWNFGDGHLHDEQLLRAVQERCHFSEGELRCICIESQPLFRQELDYRISDAATGAITRGTITIRELKTAQPWS